MSRRKKLFNIMPYYGSALSIPYTSIPPHGLRHNGHYVKQPPCHCAKVQPIPYASIHPFALCRKAVPRQRIAEIKIQSSSVHFTNALRLFAHFFMKKRLRTGFFCIFIKKSSDFFLSIEKVRNDLFFSVENKKMLLFFCNIAK